MGNSWIQFLVVVLLFGSGFLNWVLQKAKEQRQLKKVQEQRDQQKREMLRTGRTAQEAAERTPAPQGDLAARRQAQLRELRRRQEERLRELRERAQRRQQQVRQPGAQPPSMPSRVKPAAPPGVPTASAQRRRVAVPPPQPVTSAPVATRRRRPPPGVSATVAGHTIEASRDDDHQTHRLVSDVEKVSRPAIHPLAPQTARDWRAAIIASEILARPMSERESEW